MRRSPFATFVLTILLGSIALRAQEATPTAPPPVTFTTQQDHQNMLDQLGIKRLRPGRNGNSTGANPANYDEALANPYPDLPDPLLLKNGQRVTTA